MQVGGGAKSPAPPHSAAPFGDPPPVTTSTHTTAVLLTSAAPVVNAHRRRGNAGAPGTASTPSATPPTLPTLSRRTLPDLDRLSSYTDGAFFDCESPRQSGAMLSLTPSVAEIDYHEATSTSSTPAAGASDPVKPGRALPRDSSRPTHVMVDDIGRLRVESLSSDANSGSAPMASEVEYGELAQPRAEIILRWKRFLALVVLSAVVLSGVSIYLLSGITVAQNVSAAEAESRAETINTYSGVVMGFIESIVGLGFEELFPVFIVYLHNLKWYPGDAPGIKETSKFKKVALTLFIPAFMVAVGSSLSAVQANQKDQGTTSERMRARHLQAVSQTSSGMSTSLLEDTILRSVISPRVVEIPVLPAQCTPADDGFENAAGLVNALPSVRYGVPSQDWHREVDSAFTRLDDSAHVKVVLNADSEDEQLAGSGVSLSTAHELLLQGRKVARQMSPRRGSGAARSTLSRVESVSTVSDLFRQATASFSDFRVALDPDSTQITLERFALSPLIDFEGITVEMRQLGDVEVEQFCGKDACISLAAAQPTLGLPRKQITISPFSGHCLTAGDVDCKPSSHSAFVYGSTHTIRAQSSGVTTRSTNGTHASAEVIMKTTPTAVASRSLVFSFGKLSWRYDDFAHVCDTLAGSEDECQALHLQLESSSRHIVATKNAVLANLIRRSGVDALSPLVQLIEPPVVQHIDGGRQPFAVVDVSTFTGEASTNEPQCMELSVDAFASFVIDGRLRLDASTMSRAMASSGLFFLFKSGVVTESAPSVYSAVARRLATQGATVEVYLKNTGAGKVMAWVSCGVLLVLSLLVVALPNERARLEPPKGGNARAERFIAVQTEQIYPNLVYKKRFLIGKTGEEIKFRQFAVESVGLHHKMDEDEQIFL